MKTVTLWRCETCGTNYADKKSAQNCEKNHKRKIQYINMTHKSCSENPSGYPDALYVIFEDGIEVMYTRI